MLIPIAELNEKFCLQGKSIATLLKDCPDKTTIEKYKDDIVEIYTPNIVLYLGYKFQYKAKP